MEQETGHRPPVPLGGMAELEGSVRRSMAAVRDCAWLPHRDAVRGFVYELESGELRAVD